MYRSFSVNSVVLEVKWDECLWWMRVWKIEERWESSSYLIGSQCIAKMFRSFSYNTVATKIEGGECLWCMIVWKIEEKEKRVVDLLDWFLMQYQDVSLLHFQYCCLKDRVWWVSVMHDSVENRREREKSRRLTWLVLNAIPRCTAPRAPILLRPRLRVVSACDGW
jgi:hypothetical protein